MRRSTRLAIALGAICFVLILAVPIILDSSSREGMAKTRRRRSRRRNIYGKPLRSCRRRGSTAGKGSWDVDTGMCSEIDGGVHQICMNVDPATQDFSRDTYQSNWSRSRSGQTHCMCLGAWALYKARQNAGQIPRTTGELVCPAIPETALSSRYLGKWSYWNGHQIDDQVRDGVEALYKQCYAEGTPSERRYLRRRYKQLAREIGLPPI